MFALAGSGIGTGKTGVRKWNLTDIAPGMVMSAIEGKADLARSPANVAP